MRNSDQLSFHFIDGKKWCVLGLAPVHRVIIDAEEGLVLISSIFLQDWSRMQSVSFLIKYCSISTFCFFLSEVEAFRFIHRGVVKKKKEEVTIPLWC